MTITAFMIIFTVMIILSLLSSFYLLSFSALYMITFYLLCQLSSWRRLCSISNIDEQFLKKQGEIIKIDGHHINPLYR